MANVLIVEDDAVFITVWSHILKKHGHRVVRIARTPEEQLEAIWNIDGTPWDIVVHGGSLGTGLAPDEAEFPMNDFAKELECQALNVDVGFVAASGNHIDQNQIHFDAETGKVANGNVEDDFIAAVDTALRARDGLAAKLGIESITHSKEGWG